MSKKKTKKTKKTKKQPGKNQENQDLRRENQDFAPTSNPISGFPRARSAK
jgi:hypothetical protein